MPLSTDQMSYILEGFILSALINQGVSYDPPDKLIKLTKQIAKQMMK